MRRSRQEADQTRRRIVEVAARLFRARGIGAVSVADIMGELGLTVGGFYRHFATKDALVAEAIEAASLATVADKGAVRDKRALVDNYLSEEHRRHPERGCPVAALCSEIAHESRGARKAFTVALRRLLAVAGAEDDRGLARAAGVVGALVLARATDDNALAARLLKAARNAATQ